MKNKPWQIRWEFIKELSQGGQGKTHLVKRRDSEELGVLKELKSQKSIQSRARMHRESESLRTLSYKGIPRLLDSNTHMFRGNDFLFIVMEFIEGELLDKALPKKKFSVEDALSLVLSLLEILIYTHGEGVCHRDIKAANIILRSDQVVDPVLVDFGLSFNHNEDDNAITEGKERIGNRSLILPEHQPFSSLKRDPRSDITQCVGILFHVITGQQPIQLSDEKDQLPHRTARARTVLEKLPDIVRLRLNKVFDRGFLHHIDKRWQSAQELSLVLREIKEHIDQDIKDKTFPETGPGEISRRMAENRHIQNSRSLERYAEQVYKTVRGVCQEVVVFLGEGFTAVPVMVNTNLLMVNSFAYIDMSREKLSFEIWYSFRFSDIEESIFSPRIRGNMTGNELVISSFVGKVWQQGGKRFERGETTELFRFPLEQKTDLMLLRQRFTTYCLQEIPKILEARGYL